MSSPPQWPPVSVVMPVRDEADHLAEAVASVLAQDHPGPLEVVLAVAPSTDGTERVAEELAEADERVRIVPNPAGTTPAGLNRAIEAAQGEVVVRVDGHAELSPGYVRRAVELLAETGADNVGGVQQAVGTAPFQRAVAAAMSSRFGVGDAKFHYGGSPGPTDTVYLGVFRRSALDRVGGFDETLVRNQDYELNWRIRATGGVVWFDPALRVRYAPRADPGSLARQYHEYGWWKAEVLARHPASVRWRQLVPPVAALANSVGLVLGAAGRGRWRWAAAVPLGYLVAAVGASAPTARRDAAAAARQPVAFAVMHHAWATGFTGSILRRVVCTLPRLRAAARSGAR